MKKYIFSFGLAIFLLLALPVYAAETETLNGTAVVNVEKLNVRNGPSKDYEKLGTLSEGMTVEVKGIVEPDWYVIDFEGKDGYVNSEYVIFTPEEEIEAETGFSQFSQKTYVVMALIVMILIVSGIAVYTFINMAKNREEDIEDEADEELPVTSHDDTNMHLGEVTYDTYRIDIDPKYFEKTTIIPQPESIWQEENERKTTDFMQEEIAEETDLGQQVKTKTEIKNLDSKLEQASAQIAALQKEVEELKKSQTGSII